MIEREAAESVEETAPALTPVIPTVSTDAESSIARPISLEMVNEHRDG